MIPARRTAGIAGCLACALCASEPVDAQAGNVPDAAKALVVKVVSSFEAGRAPEFGAGIVFAAAGNTVYIATAGHVVQRDTVAQRIWVWFAGSRDSVEATLARPPRPGLDVAVLSVVIDAAHASRWTPRSWDRRGATRSLRPDDPVSPVGCPQGVCWQAPTPADRVVGIDRLGILFQSPFVDRGSSGGALFNAWWEVVGMVTEDAPPRANAIRIDEVLAQAEAWRLPVTLRRPAVPRGGYRASLGIAVLAPSPSPFESESDRRLLSGRITFSKRPISQASWHVALLRLAPENLGITAGMAGAALHLGVGRLALRPFLEAGFGRIQGRFDVGGYYVAGTGGNRYVPVYDRVEGDGLGIGGGVATEVIVVPRTMLEITAGYWTFTPLENAPRLNKVFVGVGMRWGV